MVVAWKVTRVYCFYYYYPVYLRVIGCLMKARLRFCSFCWGFDTRALIHHRKKKKSCLFFTRDSRVGKYSDCPWMRDVFRALLEHAAKSALNDSRLRKEKCAHIIESISVLKMSLKQFHILFVLECSLHIVTLRWVLWRRLFELKRLNMRAPHSCDTICSISSPQK